MELAGCENAGERLVELSFINKSLFHLANCIHAGVVWLVQDEILPLKEKLASAEDAQTSISKYTFIISVSPLTGEVWISRGGLEGVGCFWQRWSFVVGGGEGGGVLGGGGWDVLGGVEGGFVESGCGRKKDAQHRSAEDAQTSISKYTMHYNQY